MKKMILFFGIMLGALFGPCPWVLAAERTELEEFEFPVLYIKAINPGYTVDGVGNVGEFIELARKSSDTPLSLAGTAVSYTNSSGNTSIIFEFPENSWMTGETLLLRLASSPGAELAAGNYTKTLAFKAGIAILKNMEVIDEACWTGKESCQPEFKSSKPTALVRNELTGSFEHLTEYEPLYDEKSYMVEEDKIEAGTSQCRDLEFSEILSYYETSRDEQFIEFHNGSHEQLLLEGCKIRYKNKVYGLNGVVKADEYVVYNPKDFSLTKNPTSSNLLEVLDVDGSVVDSLSYPNGQRKGTSYALIGYDGAGKELWHITYAPTPGEPNNYQEYKTCETGKVLNRETGNCVKATAITEKTCKEGYYLNILTGRCKKVESQTEKTCKDGYYLNPETNRCRKITENSGADYSLTPEDYEEKTSFVALYAVLGLLGLGLIYLVFEFRKEIGKFFSELPKNVASLPMKLKEKNVSIKQRILELYRKVFPKSH